MQSLVELGQIEKGETYQGTATPPESLDLHFVPFTQGMLYVGSTSPLSGENLQSVQSLAEAFSIAYARYEDFRTLEDAKNRVEVTLNELKSTQEQLIQQEKLASLGQLTAGIAHEIKNPLNFVNNFSDISIDLVDEAREELKKLSNETQREDILALMNDIQLNLKKIHEHGTRADGIVKSMLQHSRGGANKMEPVDVNALIKEYVNLAFHGMRAGKEPITVEIKLELDASVGAVPLVTEDFSRVIVNLCQNAFDAMREKGAKNPATGRVNSERGAKSYSPKLIVRTKRVNTKIQIEVEDNGPGIPEEIKNKILQPFFTTKKGTQGTGLGLSITNDIVKAHRGELNIETTGTEGALFIIVLPI
jgi:signal transduction histidine kinase